MFLFVVCGTVLVVDDDAVTVSNGKIVVFAALDGVVSASVIVCHFY